MKFLHLADLHLGKSLYGVSLIDNQDQPAWVSGLLQLADEEKPDAVIIAGDIYDRSSPSGEAVQLMDRMLTGLSDRNIPVLMVAGNHDSGERLSFAGDILARENVYIAGTMEKKLRRVRLTDEFGPVNFYLLPYMFPALAAQICEDESIHDYRTAMERILAGQEIDLSERNVLIAHQNITANGQEGERGGSETMVGGVGQIDYSVFDGIDYVALGHIHAAYSVGRETVRYAGSPLCYHFDETRQKKKGPLLVTIGAKTGGRSEIRIETKEIPPLHPMREIRESYENVRALLEEDKGREEYLRIVITDRKISPQISDYLRSLTQKRGSILMELVSEYHQSALSSDTELTTAENKTAEELFMQFYRERKAEADPDPIQKAILHRAGEMMRSELRQGLREADEADVEKLLAFALKEEA